MNKIRWKTSSWYVCVLVVHVACLWICVLFFLSVVTISACAYVFKSKVHCGSVFKSKVHCGSAVRFDRALPGFLITAHQFYAFLL